MHPVGPLPPRVYWTRRIVLLGVLAVLLIAIAVSCSGGSDGGRGDAATPRPSSTPSNTPTVAALLCTRAQLSVSASTDAPTYAAGVLPRLRLTVRNIGRAPCTFVDSASTRSWTVVSGPDRVWTTDGCTRPRNATQTTLAAGASVRHAFVWNRHRSGKGCTASTVEAAAGTYQLVVSANGVTSAPAIFHLTG